MQKHGLGADDVLDLDLNLYYSVPEARYGSERDCCKLVTLRLKGGLTICIEAFTLPG